MKRLNQFRESRGFSYIEVVVIIAIIAMLSIVLMDVFISHGELFNTTMANVDLQMQRARTLERLGSMTRVASSVQFSQTIDGVLYTTSDDTLVLGLPSIDATGAVIDNAFDYAALYLDAVHPNELRLVIGANAASSRTPVTQLLSDKVAGLTFQYDRFLPEESETVFVQAVFSTTSSGTDESVDVSGVFNLGNQ